MILFLSIIPESNESVNGFDGNGIAVMAVTNLPCEFSIDASAQFSENLAPLMSQLMKADFTADNLDEANLPDPIRKAVILWKGEFTEAFSYMKEYL